MKIFCGFMLIEVLVVFVIVVIVLGVGIKVVGVLINNVECLVQVSVVQWCVENLLIELWLI